MKKLLTVCAACMVASLASAAVESQNIVGYNTVTLDKTWTIMAVNFTGVGNPELGLNDAVPYSDGMTKGNTTSTADVLQIQTAVGYDVYYMINGLDAKSGPVS
ncbi:MAG: hypothetical protein PF904_04965, partial [Kiritimatiellae bacterium]|nr:hypothetical protein [Kiritimatiellia bacterium]